MNATLILATVLAIAPAIAFAAPMTAATYVMKAGASDKYETESSRLVLDSANPKVASFAQMMIDDHAKSTNDVVAAAQADGMLPAPAKLMPKQTAMIASLKKLSGPKRDALYERQQVAAHKETLVFQKEYSMLGDKPHLKTTAGQIVPVVEHHLTMVEAMVPTKK